VTEKLNIVIAIDEPPAPAWDSVRPLANLIFVRDGRQAYHYLSTQPVDMIFIDLQLTGMDSIELLHRVRTEHLCRSIVLTSEAPSFSFAQQGIQYGVSAYLLRPLQESELEAQTRRLVSSVSTPNMTQQNVAQEVVSRLRLGDGLTLFLQAGQRLLPLATEGQVPSGFWRDFYKEVLNAAYHRYPWLKSYHKPDEFAPPDYGPETSPRLALSLCQKALTRLQNALVYLMPVTDSPQLEQIMVFLLESVNMDVQQREVAEQFYITASTLSTRFQKHLGLSYRTYLTRLKMQRARYLLRYTTVRESSLAALLGYKDKEHFAKLFVQYTGQSLHAYRQRGWRNQTMEMQ
jgi:two-component system response regulator YesN